jgi:hypothetical protein
MKLKEQVQEATGFKRKTSTSTKKGMRTRICGTAWITFRLSLASH